MKQKQIFIAALFFTITGFSRAGFSQTQAQMKKLDAGDIIISLKEDSGSEIPKAHLIAVVDSAPSKVWEIVSNCNKFKQRMPRIANAKIVSVKGKRVTCDVEIDLPFPLSNLHAKTVALHQAGPKVWTRKWKLVDGDFDFNNGSWKLSFYKDDPNRTYVEYRIHASPKTSVPVGVRKMLQKSSLKKMIINIREHAKKL